VELVIDSTQLKWAGLRGELIGLLVERGADVNRDRSKLLWTGLIAQEPELVRTLIDEGASVDLRFAAGANRVDLMADFFDAEGRLKGDVGHLYHPDPDTLLTGEQILVEALNFAAYSGALEAAELLLDHGADIDGFAGAFHSWDHGSTPLHKTVMTDQLEMARFLLARGADLLVEDLRFDSTPLVWTDHNETSEALDDLIREHHRAALERAAGP
jgi:hypothetical protein